MTLQPLVGQHKSKLKLLSRASWQRHRDQVGVIEQRIERLFSNVWLRSLTLTVLALGLSSTALEVGTSKYSTDSWTYFELAKSVFGEDFYRANTVRSYFSLTYSAAFPFAFPVLLALVHQLVGLHPVAAVWTNIALALGTCVVLYQIARALRLSDVGCVVVASSLVLYPFYLIEVFAGRAIPLALFAFFCGWYCCIRGRFLIAGFFLGCAALARFDFLVYAMLFQALWFLQPAIRWRQSVRVACAFAVTLSPWVYYSLHHFGVVWVSDNSWVAASAMAADVLDYPAAPTLTATENPARWIHKVAGNVPALMHQGAFAALVSPGLVVLVCAVGFNLKKVATGTNAARAFYWLLALAMAATPYLATGYFDSRYFILSIVLMTLFLVRRIEVAPGFSVAWFNRISLLSIALLANVVTGTAEFVRETQIARDRASATQTEERLIGEIARCHTNAPHEVLIFAASIPSSTAAKYGALTGLRAAIIPANFAQMNQNQKAVYFESMVPFVLIESLSGNSNHARCEDSGVS